jgi:ubiquinone/menaquinone biosynthesis C-methylase UbiE
MSQESNSNFPAFSGVMNLIKFLNPKAIIGQLEILPGMTVAHFGCGTGYFTFAVAEKMGEMGRVYAFDILEEKIEAVNSRAKLEGFNNIYATRANLEEKEGSGLEEESVDWVVIVNMLYQNNDKSRIIGEAKRILKKGGHVLLIDWKATGGPLGPDIGSRVSREDLIKIIKKNELGILKEMEISNFHFGMILVK